MKFLHERYRHEPALLHRFVEEAQIGGQLQHPGIVPVYDLGMVDGRPFFTMKLVKGQTLAKRLAERASPDRELRSFLSIFEDVCQTMAYAHARGVVHRDLKPANIMIGSFGEVQVVDWGMGKVLASGGVADERLASERQAEVSVVQTVRSSGHGTQSLVGSVMGTPAYMPPEQARGDVEQMDERSDVFALGAILCEILTGKPPYLGAADELIAMAAMARLDDARARLAACTAEREMAELATRCLMPAPAARPRSAEVVAREVHDHLAAVEARVHEARVEAAEARVRAAALRRTQRLGISLTAVIAAGLLASLWLWRRADEAADRERIARADAVASAAAARDNEVRAVEQTRIAERELARAVEIQQLLTGMLSGIQPEQARQEDTTLLRRILGNTSARLAAGAVTDELVAAELHQVTGVVYQAIGENETAETHLDAALAIRSRLLGEEHRQYLAVRTQLAVLRRDQGRFAEAEAIARATLAVQERVLGKEHPDALAGTCNLAVFCARQGRLAEAEPLYLEVLEAARRTLGEDDQITRRTRSNLASLLLQQQRHEEAEVLLLESLGSLERTLGEDHVLTLTTMGNLASLYSDTGRLDAAERIMLRVIEIQGRVLPEGHVQQVGTMNNLALLYDRQGRLPEAVGMLVVTLERMRRSLGDLHPDTLGTINNLARTYLQLGRPEDAAPLVAEALEGRRQQLGPEHAETLQSMRNMVHLRIAQGRLAEAMELGAEALEVARRVHGEEHPQTLAITGQVADLHFQRGQAAEAEKLVKVALAIQRRGGGDDPATAKTLTQLAMLYLQLGRLAASEPLLVEALDILARHPGREPSTAADAMGSLGVIRLGSGRFDEAEPLLTQSLELQERLFGADHERLVAPMGNLAIVHMQRGQLEEAERLHLRTLAIQKRTSGPEHPNTLGVMTNLGGLYNQQRRFEEAAALFEVSLPGKRRRLGMNHPWTVYALNGLATAYAGLGRVDDALPLQRELLELQLRQAERRGADAQTMNQGAWQLLNHEVEALRDPARALALAERACQRADEDDAPQLWLLLDTLALAQHRSGDARAAVETQRRAVSLTPAEAEPAVAAELRARLAEYEAAARDR
jgi:hypothetical protein